MGFIQELNLEKRDDGKFSVKEETVYDEEGVKTLLWALRSNWEKIHQTILKAEIQISESTEQIKKAQEDLEIMEGRVDKALDLAKQNDINIGFSYEDFKKNYLQLSADLSDRLRTMRPIPDAKSYAETYNISEEELKNYAEYFGAVNGVQNILHLFGLEEK